MKNLKQLAYGMLFLLSLPAFVFCTKEPEPEPEPVVGEITFLSENSLVFSDDGESQQVAFTATLDWTASTGDDFVTIEPVSGQAGENSVTIRLGENPNYELRTATVTLTCGEDTKTVQLTQKQKGALILEEPTINVEAEGGRITITAKATADVTASVAPAAQEWISEVKLKNSIKDYDFEFEIAPNESEYPRSGQINFTSDNKKEVITIKQAGVPTVVKPVVECKQTSSSSLVFEWTNGGNAADDALLPYKIALYKDAE